MELFKPAWMDSDMQKAMEFTGKCTAERQLARACAESPYLEVRVMAAEKIKTPSFLVKAAAAVTDPVTLRALSASTTDSSVLAKMLIATPVTGEEADGIYSRIRDDRELAEVALSGKYLSETPGRITDGTVLTELAEALFSRDGEENYRAGALCAEKSGNAPLIYRYAMKAASLEQWYVCRQTFTSLMRESVYNRDLSVHLRQLEIAQAQKNIRQAVTADADA